MSFRNQYFSRTIIFFIFLKEKRTHFWKRYVIKIFEKRNSYEKIYREVKRKRSQSNYLSSESKD